MAELRKGVTPEELADLVDLSERPRSGGWSLRAALTRYAQPEPVRVSRLLDLVRRIEVALGDRTDELRANGPALWAALAADGGADGGIGAADPTLVGVLGAAREIDRLGDLLAEWADGPSGDRRDRRPDDAFDDVIAEVTTRLAELGVPQQERPGPPAGRARRGRG